MFGCVRDGVLSLVGGSLESFGVHTRVEIEPAGEVAGFGGGESLGVVFGVFEEKWFDGGVDTESKSVAKGDLVGKNQSKEVVMRRKGGQVEHAGVGGGDSDGGMNSAGVVDFGEKGFELGLDKVGFGVVKFDIGLGFG